MVKKISTFEDLIAEAGNATKLAALMDVHAYAVLYWKNHGIPTKYWDSLSDLFSLTPGDLYEISKKCKTNIKDLGEVNNTTDNATKDPGSSSS